MIDYHYNEEHLDKGYKNQSTSLPISGSGSGRLKSDSLLNGSAFLQPRDHLLDAEAFVENSLVSCKQILDPLLGEEGKSAAFASDNVPVEVERSYLMLGWLLLVLENELLNVLAAFEQLLPVLHLEHCFRPVIPPLAFDHADWTQGFRVDLHLVRNVLAAELPVGFGGGKCGD